MAGPAPGEGKFFRVVRRAVDVQPNELRALGWSCAYFFFILSAYYIIRPLREEMGVAGGVRNLPWLFTGTLTAMLVVHPPFAALVARFPRTTFVPVANRFFAANLLIFFVLFRVLPQANAVVVYMMDVSGSMTDDQKEIVRTAAFWLDTWLRSQYEGVETRYVIHDAAAKNEKYSGGRFVRDDKSEMLVIYGHEKNMPPLDPTDKGHFHAESAEMWLVFSGKIRYAFEGQQPFIAGEGDVVYVPSNTWHATRFVGDNACRLSITEYVGNALLLPPQ